MAIRTEPVTINLGPQHPSTHGVFRLRVTFDGEVVIDVEPVFGYLHRGTEKRAESRSYVQIVTLTDRLDYVASMSNNLAYVLAVGKRAWSLELIRKRKRIEDGDLIITWSAGQNSALDHRDITQGRDIGNVVVQRRTTEGLQGGVHDLTFAFVFHAFSNGATIQQ